MGDIYCPAIPGFIYEERIITYHSLSCVCPQCRTADIGAAANVPLKEVRIKPGARAGIVRTGKKINGLIDSFT